MVSFSVAAWTAASSRPSRPEKPRSSPRRSSSPRRGGSLSQRVASCHLPPEVHTLARLKRVSIIQHTHTPSSPSLRHVCCLCCTATFAFWPRLHSFSIGLEHSPDHVAARKAAHYLGTVHHEYVFTVQEGLDAIPEVIYHLETYDVTTVRASTPMYLLSRKIKAMGVKMVLSGEGSDEIFGGEPDFLLLSHLGTQPPESRKLNLRRLSLFPRGSGRTFVPPGMHPQSQKSAHGRLPPC